MKKSSECYAPVQVTRIVLKNKNCLSSNATIFINCHFHHCTAKKQKGCGFRDSFTWFFNYIATCFNTFARQDSLPCFLLGDFNQAAYNSTIPCELTARNVTATRLGIQQDCIACYYLGNAPEFKFRCKKMNTERWKHYTPLTTYNRRVTTVPYIILYINRCVSYRQYITVKGYTRTSVPHYTSVH